MQDIQKRPLIEPLISQILPMSAIQEAFELSASNQTGKDTLHPWE